MYGNPVDSSVWMQCQRRAIERRRLERLTLRLSSVALVLVVSFAGVVGW